MTMKTTCLHDRHTALGALMSPFAGYDMPISYAGIEQEHNAVRESVGVFDVSHMGEVLVEGPQAQQFVNYIFTGDVSTIGTGKVMYGMMLNERGGTVDDLLVYKYSDEKFLLVINASNIDKDVAWIQNYSGRYDVKVEDLSGYYAELAIQGPDAEKTVKEILDIDVSDLTFYTFKEIGGMIVSRTGYTGEDGFEIYAAADNIIAMWDRLMTAGVEPCGLGCRDTLRFEAGLPLYGDELSEDITPHEATLSMFAKLDKPADYIGRAALAEAKAAGLKRKTVGLEIDGRAIARHGYPVLDSEGRTVGEVTTGYHSITLGKNLAMAIIDVSSAALGTSLQVQVRKKVFPAKVVKKRFYTPKYKK